MADLSIQNFGALSQIYQEPIYLIPKEGFTQLFEFDQGNKNAEIIVLYHENGRSLNSEELDFLKKVIMATQKDFNQLAIVNCAKKSLNLDEFLDGASKLVIAFIQGTTLQLEYWKPNTRFEYFSKQMILLQPISFTSNNNEAKKFLWHELKSYFSL